jgi:hypothetical protein
MKTQKISSLRERKKSEITAAEGNNKTIGSLDYNRSPNNLVNKVIILQPYVFKTYLTSENPIQSELVGAERETESQKFYPNKLYTIRSLTKTHNCTCAILLFFLFFQGAC